MLVGRTVSRSSGGPGQVYTLDLLSDVDVEEVIWAICGAAAVCQCPRARKRIILRCSKVCPRAEPSADPQDTSRKLGARTQTKFELPVCKLPGSPESTISTPG